MKHSDIVGGSTAARVINCPGSVSLVRQMPPAPASDYANEGSMLHEAIAVIIGENLEPESMKGIEAHGVTLTDELYESKLWPYIDAFDEYLVKLEEDKKDTASILVEQEVSFGDAIPGAFGSCDVLIRVGDRVVVLDWKFGDGVQVEPQENAQLLFYCAAAMRTVPELFKDAAEVDLVIVQGGEARVWETTLSHVHAFERKLVKAVKLSGTSNAPLKEGRHCRWCAAKAICPLFTGAVQRAVKADLAALPVEELGLAVEQSYLLEQWIKDLRQLVERALEQGVAVPGCKLVAKRGRREWVSEEKMVEGMLGVGLTLADITKEEFLSPAQVEKVLKKRGLAFPEGLVATVSSGHTLALESDKRPAVDDMAALGEALRQME